MYKVKTVKIPEDTHWRLSEMCSKNVTFGDIITFILEAYERSMYYALNGGNLYELGYCKDSFEALEIAKEEEGYNPYVQTKIFHGRYVVTKSGDTRLLEPEIPLGMVLCADGHSPDNLECTRCDKYPCKEVYPSQVDVKT